MYIKKLANTSLFVILNYVSFIEKRFEMQYPMQGCSSSLKFNTKYQELTQTMASLVSPSSQFYSLLVVISCGRRQTLLSPSIQPLNLFKKTNKHRLHSRRSRLECKVRPVPSHLRSFPPASSLNRGSKLRQPCYWTGWRRQSELGLYLSLPVYMRHRAAQIGSGTPAESAAPPAF